MSSIIDFFSHFFDYILDAFSSCLSWFLDLISSTFDSVLVPLADAIPDLGSYWSLLSGVAPYYAVLNSFFPLHECGYFIAAYFAFSFVFLVVKYVVKIFIPFVG
jgi:hypothetical protein